MIKLISGLYFLFLQLNFKKKKFCFSQSCDKDFPLCTASYIMFSQLCSSVRFDFQGMFTHLLLEKQKFSRALPRRDKTSQIKRYKRTDLKMEFLAKNRNFPPTPINSFTLKKVLICIKWQARCSAWCPLSLFFPKSWNLLRSLHCDPDCHDNANNHGDRSIECSARVASITVTMAVGQFDSFRACALDAIRLASWSTLPYQPVLTHNILCEDTALDVGAVWHAVPDLLLRAVL